MSEIVIRHLGVVEYLPTWAAMQDFTAQRDAGTADEIWLLQHPPVYTLGLNGKPEHLPRATAIPVIKIDRGGQITYHGPGQIVAYLLIDLKRRGYGVRELVSGMEQAVIEVLADCGVTAQARKDAPGVYVDGRKIAALGLRIKHGCSYHGLAFNVDMDLSPFAAIDPCGYAGLEVTQTRDMGVSENTETLADRLVRKLADELDR